MSIIEEIKSVTSVIQKIDNIELYRQILDIQKEALDLLEDNRKLIQQNNELKEILQMKKDVLPERNSYWVKKEDGSLDGPFCTRCFDVENKLVRIHPSGYSKSWFTCPEPKCKAEAQVYPEESRTGIIGPNRARTFI